MRHRDVWRALDLLAERHGLSPSGLARLAGLDQTTFNKSKRNANNGRPRWPSSESIARVLKALGIGLGDFADLIDMRKGINAPLIGLAQAGSDGFFDDAGFPRGGGWEQICFPASHRDEHVYALEISGDSMEPAYRDGDRIIISPGAQICPGDRVVARTIKGEVMAKILGRQTQTVIELLSLNAAYPARHLKPCELEWMARILWVSQ